MQELASSSIYVTFFFRLLHRYVSYILPQTYACEAIRAVLYKGWDITHTIVYLGYLVTVAWLFIHLAIALIAIRIRK